MRDLDQLKSAGARPQDLLDSIGLYSEIFLKAAELLNSLVNNHPFVDGNKRIGTTAEVLFLQANVH